METPWPEARRGRSAGRDRPAAARRRPARRACPTGRAPAASAPPKARLRSQDVSALHRQRHRVVGDGAAEPVGVCHRWNRRRRTATTTPATGLTRSRQTSRRPAAARPADAAAGWSARPCRPGGRPPGIVVGRVGELLERHVDRGSHRRWPTRSGCCARRAATCAVCRNAVRPQAADQQQRRRQQGDRARDQAQRRDEEIDDALHRDLRPGGGQVVAKPTTWFQSGVALHARRYAHSIFPRAQSNQVWPGVSDGPMANEAIGCAGAPTSNVPPLSSTRMRLSALSSEPERHRELASRGPPRGDLPGPGRPGEAQRALPGRLGRRGQRDHEADRRHRGGPSPAASCRTPAADRGALLLARIERPGGAHHHARRRAPDERRHRRHRGLVAFLLDRRRRLRNRPEAASEPHRAPMQMREASHRTRQRPVSG